MMFDNFKTYSDAILGALLLKFSKLFYDAWKFVDENQTKKEQADATIPRTSR